MASRSSLSLRLARQLARAVRAAPLRAASTRAAAAGARGAAVTGRDAPSSAAVFARTEASARRAAFSSSTSGQVVEIGDGATLEKLIADAPVLVVDWSATWCGPCQNIAPHYASMAEAHADKQFIKVDIDTLGDEAMDAGVRAVPTFQVYKQGAKTGEVVGADLDALAKLLA